MEMDRIATQPLVDTGKISRGISRSHIYLAFISSMPPSFPFELDKFVCFTAGSLRTVKLPPPSEKSRIGSGRPSSPLHADWNRTLG